MEGFRQGQFGSASDFLRKFFNLFRGPYGSCETFDKVFPEKIRLAVTFANDCSG